MEDMSVLHPRYQLTQLFSVALASFFVIFFGVHSAQAIGVTPPEMTIASVLRDTEQTVYVSLVKDLGQLNSEIKYSATVQSDYPNAVKVEPIITATAGEQSVLVPIVVNTNSLSNGTYEARVVFYELADATSSTSQNTLSIRSGVSTRIVFSVSDDERVEYEISNLQAQSTETDDTVPVQYTIHNTGNVTFRPEKVDYIFADQDDSQNTVTATIQEGDIPVIQPGEERIILSTVDPELVQGTYVLTAVFYDDGQEVKRLTTQQFDVFAPNTLAQSGNILNYTTNKKTYNIGERIQLNADFENTGDIRVSGVMVTSIEKDDSIVDLRTTSQLDIDPGETSQFEDVFALNTPGKYSLVVYIEYGNKKTQKQTIEITVRDPQSQTRIIPYLIVICIGSAIAAYVILKLKKNSHAKIE